MTAAPASATPETPQVEGARPRQPWRRWSLQTRLMITVIGIVALTLVVSAGGIGATIGQVLVANVDDRLTSSTEQVRLYEPGFISPRERTAAEALTEGYQEPGYVLLVRSSDGSVSGAVVTGRNTVRTLSDTQLSDLQQAATGDGPWTVSITGLGSYRMKAYIAGDVTGLAASPLAEVNTTVAQLLTTILLVTIGGLLLLSAAIAVVIQRSLKPLRAVAETATRVAALPLAQGEVTIAERVPASEADDRSEIGRVGAALNTLLDHVDASLDARQRNEERMRAFVADASHELRTPLASIRGYSELSLRALRQGLSGSEANTESALERIQAQSLRMSSLVEDLLLLARLDEGQDLVYGAVDLTRLSIDAVADAQVAGPDHEWVLEVGDEPVVVAGDATRITQVVANLLANARIHTPAGTTVTASVSTSVSTGGGTAIVRVHDDGPGIDPAIADELFQRFSRADRSRARQSGGTGLGLSIAQAIVTAHGGSLTAESAPGSTTFELRLPARPADPSGAGQ